jgi:hypothetical protein
VALDSIGLTARLVQEVAQKVVELHPDDELEVVFVVRSASRADLEMAVAGVNVPDKSHAVRIHLSAAAALGREVGLRVEATVRPEGSLN